MTKIGEIYHSTWHTRAEPALHEAGVTRLADRTHRTTSATRGATRGPGPLASLDGKLHLRCRGRPYDYWYDLGITRSAAQKAKHCHR